MMKCLNITSRKLKTVDDDIDECSKRTFLTVADETFKYIITENLSSYICRHKHYRVVFTLVF